jgi:hypothetical protein
MFVMERYSVYCQTRVIEVCACVSQNYWITIYVQPLLEYLINIEATIAEVCAH